MNRSSRSQMCYEISVLENFGICTEKQVFSCEYCKIFWTTFFIKHLRWLLLDEGFPKYMQELEEINNFWTNDGNIFLKTGKKTSFQMWYNHWRWRPREKRHRGIFSTLQYICDGTFFKNKSQFLAAYYNCKKVCHWCLAGLKCASVLSRIQI